MQDSGTYTCASPRGLTNSITIVVAGKTINVDYSGKCLSINLNPFYAVYFYLHMNSVSMSYNVRTEFTAVVTFGRYQIGSESNLQVLYNNLRFMNLKCHFIPSFININDHPTCISFYAFIHEHITGAKWDIFSKETLI